jgi:hypothetical protein
MVFSLVSEFKTSLIFANEFVQRDALVHYFIVTALTAHRISKQTPGATKQK